MNLRTIKVIYLTLVLILGIIYQAHAAEGNSQDGQNPEENSEVTRLRLESWIEISSLVSLSNPDEFLCLAEKLLLFMFKYMFFFIKMISITDANKASSLFERSAGMTKLLALDHKYFKHCFLIAFTKATQIAAFVDKEGNSELLVQMERKSLLGLKELIYFMLGNLLKLISTVRIILRHLMTIFSNTNDAQLDMMISAVVDVYQDLLNVVESYGLSLSSLSSDDLTRIITENQDAAATLVSNFGPVHTEIEAMKLLKETREKKLAIAKRLGDSGVESEKIKAEKSKCRMTDPELLFVGELFLTVLNIF